MTHSLPHQSISTSTEKDGEEEKESTREGVGLFFGFLGGLLVSAIFDTMITATPQHRAASSKAQEEADFTRLLRSINLTADEIRVAMLCKDVILDSIQTLTCEKLAPFKQMEEDIKQKKQQKQQQKKQPTQQETQQQKQQQKHQKATKKGDLVDPMPGWFWGGR